MDSKEKSNFINHLRFHVKDSNKGFKYFLEKWNELTNDDADTLKEALKAMCIQELSKEDSISSSFFEFEQVLNYVNELNTYFPETKKFLLSNGAKDKSIVKVFMELKNRGFINNTNEEIAKLVSLVFNIKQDTAYRYLKNPGSMSKTKDLLS
jgi:hypothetical protein